MEKQTKKAPRLRFPEFTDDWEQRKLGELSEKVIKKNQDAVIDEVFTNSAEFGIISQRDFFEKSIANTENINGYYVVEPDDFVYNPRISTTAPFGPIRRNKLERTGAMSPLYYVFRPHDVDLSYLEWYFKTSCWYSFMSFNGNSGARSDRFAITDKIFNEMPILMPHDIVEQKQIGAFLSKIESFITLHQRKLDSIKEYKKGMLQKMFPKKGEKVPEIRFSGFTDEWEQCKLGDYCEMFNGDRSSKYPNAQDMVLEGIPFINAGDLVDGHVNLMSAKKISREKYEDLGGAKLRLGDIVYCLRGTLGKNAYIDNFDEGTVASSLVAIRPKNIDGKYLFHVLNSDIEYRQRVVRDEGAAQPNLSAKSVSEYLIPMPDIEEQKTVSSFLTNLDETITLHQRKLDELKELKKGLLQQMFV